MVTTPPEGTVSGLVVVDKPADWTSHDVVAKMRGLVGTRKVGHAGTLDPMATGVLVLGIGQATRLLTFAAGADKDYDATIRLGVSTVTDDAEGEVMTRVDASAVRDEAITDAVAGLTGEIDQVPSAVSAIKVEGQRSYARVRAGKDVELAARRVNVSRFEVLDSRRATEEGAAAIDLDVSVTVSSGTYVRALARDLGTVLGVGGHLTALRRTRVAGFTLARATPLNDLVEARERGERLPLISLAAAASALLPTRVVTEDEATEISHGRRIPRLASDGTPTRDAPLALLSERGRLVAFAAGSSHLLRPIAVFLQPPDGPGGKPSRAR